MDNTLALWFMLICILFSFAACGDNKSGNPLTYESPRPGYCAHKGAGSRPACWRESDWKAYCSRVKCK